MATYDPTTGETPLENLPQYGGAGGSFQAAQYYAAKDFAEMFGRNPTASELALLAPSYQGADPNIANLAGGKAQLAAYYQQQSQTPTNIYNKQQSDLKAKAPQYYDQVSQLFQSNLGRDATDAEKTHFGMLMASGQDPYEIQQALQQTTEYNTAQTQKFTGQLQNQMQTTNADYFSKYILPSIQAANAQAGRTQDSSGYQAQLANAGQQQNYDLQNYLAQVAASGYQGSVTNNAQNYQALLGQQYGLSNANVSNQLANNAANTQYNQNLDMYNRQQQAYQNYLNAYGKRNNGLGSLIGGGLGAGIGAYFGGPAGATVGYNLGSGLGNTVQSSQRGYQI